MVVGLPSPGRKSVREASFEDGAFGLGQMALEAYLGLKVDMNGSIWDLSGGEESGEPVRVVGITLREPQFSLL